MLKTFNCGIGLIIIISMDKKKQVTDLLKENKSKFLGIMGKTQKEKKINIDQKFW